LGVKSLFAAVGEVALAFDKTTDVVEFLEFHFKIKTQTRVRLIANRANMGDCAHVIRPAASFFTSLRHPHWLN
jgi:hypothetical protein